MLCLPGGHQDLLLVANGQDQFQESYRINSLGIPLPKVSVGPVAPDTPGRFDLADEEQVPDLHPLQLGRGHPRILLPPPSERRSLSSPFCSDHCHQPRCKTLNLFVSSSAAALFAQDAYSAVK